MQKLFHSRFFIIGIVCAVIAFVVYMMIASGNSKNQDAITTTAENGVVRQLVSVSGIAKAEQNAELAFPVSGIVQSVGAKEGAVVEAGTTLVTLESQALYADRQNALADIARVDADRDELIAGPTGSARDVTAQTYIKATQNLKTITENEERKVENAKRTLLSSDLTAYSDDPAEDASAPTISGTYTCEQEGTYTITLFSSGAESGYSYRLSGIESGTYPASTQQAVALGTCGLRARFDENSTYGRTVWQIDIPNTKSSTYVTNRNAYALAVTQAESAITNAEQEVTLAKANATNQNAPARQESLKRADAAISQAYARLARIDADINNRILKAPFAGTITEIDILPGETVSLAPVVTLLAASDFKITARIPEIDIGKIARGQKVEMVFDARSDQTVYGVVDFISLTATIIDGVAYYEALIIPNENPVWIRSGLNADIDIILEESVNTLRLPKRFITESEGEYTVLIRNGTQTATTTIEIIFQGNDGYTAITGINEGDIVVAP